MRKVLIGGLCVSLIAGLSACNNPTTAVKSPEASQTATAVSQALGSGIEFAHFDNSIRPQDDFYQYVNGTWLKNTEIPSDRTSIGAFYDLREKSRDDVKAIIEQVAAMPNLIIGSDEQKVADLYRSFMDTATLNKLGISPIQGELDAIAALKDKNELVRYFAHSQIIGGGTPMAFYIDIDAKNSSRYATHLYQYGLSLPEKD
ncbi:MAG: peptidase M13, partial [Shewanella sp.]